MNILKKERTLEIIDIWPKKTTLDNGTVIWDLKKNKVHPEAVIGENCTIHLCKIYSGVTIGNDTKIEADVFIPDGITIGNQCFIGPGVKFANDKKPPSGGAEWAKTFVEDDVSIGMGSLIGPGVRIGSGAKIGMGCVIRHDIPAGAKVRLANSCIEIIETSK